MTSDFLIALRAEANALRSKIGTALHASGQPGPRLTGQAPFPPGGQPLDPHQPAHNPTFGPVNLADVDTHAAKLLAMIDAEIRRQPTRQEYESQMLDRSPLPGETARQTSDRLKAQDFDNPLVARPA